MERCNHTGQRGQCPYYRVDGSDYCVRHKNEKQRIRGYLLNDPELRERMEHHSNSDLLKSVEQEIVLLRSLVEERLNEARTIPERQAAFGMVNSAFANINKMVESLVKLEKLSGETLSRGAVMKFGAEIVDILAEELSAVPDSDNLLERIAERIADAIAKVQNEP